jgi:ADP-heptose:LPS heptosyltransferase
VATPEKYHCIFENNPHVTRCVDLAKDDIPAFIDVFNLTHIDGQSEVSELRKSGVIKTTRPQVYVKAVGGSTTNDSNAYVPKLYVKKQQIKWAKDRFMNNPELTYILTPLQAAEVYRTWNRERYDELFRLAAEEHPDWCFVLPGGTRLEETMPDNVIDATGFSFRRTIHLAAAADIILTPDTSLLHVAAALSKPCVTLFGPIAAEARCQFYPTVTCIRAKLKCIPCWRNATEPCLFKKDKNSPSHCLEQISSVKVLRVLEEKIEEIS